MFKVTLHLMAKVDEYTEPDDKGISSLVSNTIIGPITGETVSNANVETIENDMVKCLELARSQISTVTFQPKSTQEPVQD